MTGTWGVLAVTLTIQALVSLAVLAVPAMAPAMALELHVSPSLVGAYVAVVYLGAMLASTVAGPLVVRYGAMRVSQAGLLVCAAGMLILAALPSMPVAAIGAFLTGVGYGPITPASSHLLARSTPPHRASLVFSVKQTGVPLGGVVAGAFVPALVIIGGAAVALYTVALGCVVCTALAQPIRNTLDSDRQSGHRLNVAKLGAPVSLVMRDPSLRPLAAFSFVFSAMQMCLASYLVTYMNSELGYSLVAAGAALSVAQMGGVAGRILWGYVADRWLGARPMLAVVAATMAGSAAAAALLTAGVPRVPLLALLAIFGASATGWNGVYLAEVARLAPRGSASAATGGSLAITFLGVVVGPVIFGAVSGLFGTFRAGYLALALPAAYCAWELRRSRPAPIG